MPSQWISLPRLADHLAQIGSLDRAIKRLVDTGISGGLRARSGTYLKSQLDTSSSFRLPELKLALAEAGIDPQHSAQFKKTLCKDRDLAFVIIDDMIHLLIRNHDGYRIYYHINGTYGPSLEIMPQMWEDCFIAAKQSLLLKAYPEYRTLHTFRDISIDIADVDRLWPSLLKRKARKAGPSAVFSTPEKKEEARRYLSSRALSGITLQDFYRWVEQDLFPDVVGPSESTLARHFAPIFRRVVELPRTKRARL